mmetsp:Transcript_8194/g.23435  ORF Transcript_8194/g.23435 Transcript_8194/m.23435 type:complete len:268 (+) Transcript_8194:149-952(+)
MALSSEVLLCCGVSSVLGIAVNFCVYQWHRRLRTDTGIQRCFGLDRTLLLETLDADLWIHVVSMVYQAVVYPACIMFGWLAWHLSSGHGRWLDRRGGAFDSDGGLDLVGIRLFAYAFFGYLVRDLPSCWSDPLIILHHLVCWIGIVVSLHAPAAAVPLFLSMFAFECGSCAYNGWIVDEALSAAHRDRKHAANVYQLLFTISNIAGAYLGLLATWQHWILGHTGFASFFLICGVPLVLIRQKECTARIRPGGKKSRHPRSAADKECD